MPNDTVDPWGTPPGGGRKVQPQVPRWGYGLYANPFANPDTFAGMDRAYLNATPDAAFGLLKNLFKGPSASADWLSRQYNDLWSKFGGQQAADPTLSWLSYLGNLDLGQMYNAQSPFQRGERASVYSPRMRWI